MFHLVRILISVLWLCTICISSEEFKTLDADITQVLDKPFIEQNFNEASITTKAALKTWERRVRGANIYSSIDRSELTAPSYGGTDLMHVKYGHEYCSDFQKIWKQVEECLGKLIDKHNSLVSFYQLTGQVKSALDLYKDYGEPLKKNRSKFLENVMSIIEGHNKVLIESFCKFVRSNGSIALRCESYFGAAYAAIGSLFRKVVRAVSGKPVFDNSPELTREFVSLDELEAGKLDPIRKTIQTQGVLGTTQKKAGDTSSFDEVFRIMLNSFPEAIDDSKIEETPAIEEILTEEEK